MSFNDATIKLDKLYYSIGEVANYFDVNSSLIRFWEKEFSIIKPAKNKKGNRLFTQKDIQNFQLIYQLVKVEGYTLDGAKLRLKKEAKSETSASVEEAESAVQILESIKLKLLTLKNNM
ncbi:MAG: MerR family transcriptional regulator [Crocinitomix sp.]|nr:MerR family transcriptional regulator [Crocinitomix sp.]